MHFFSDYCHEGRMCSYRLTILIRGSSLNRCRLPFPSVADAATPVIGSWDDVLPGILDLLVWSAIGGPF